MDTSERLLHALRTWHKMPAAALLERLGVSRATLMRAVHALGPQVIALGKARRTVYAARRPIRGQLQEAVPLCRIDAQGRPHESALLHPLHPQGDDGDMADGWFEGLPYMLDDMRPQGFLGRHFARHHADLLQVASDPKDWSEDDVLHALTLLGHDQVGHYVLGELALPGAFAGGEFPKFTAFRDLGDVAGRQAYVIVKFSGSDASPGTVRWSDLLVCEHLALCTVARHLDVQASVSRVFQADGRTFLEVERFDRHGRLGRSHQPGVSGYLRRQCGEGARGEVGGGDGRSMTSLRMSSSHVWPRRGFMAWWAPSPAAEIASMASLAAR